MAMGVDAVEPDIVATSDGVLVVRHENEISGTTDVADRPEFADRQATKRVDGLSLTGWFTEDFTLAELRTLRARERLPELRGTDWDGRETVPTFDEIVDLVAEASQRHGRVIGLIPEIKHGRHFQAIGLEMEGPLLRAIAAHDYTRRAPVWIQSFEVGNLRALRDALGEKHEHVRLLQLLGAPDRRPVDGDRTYLEMAQPEGLRRIAEYADGIGPPVRFVIPLDDAGGLGAPTGLVQAAHAAGLRVLPYTFRPENHFLAPRFRDDRGPAAHHPEGAVAELRAYLATGIDGFFSDDVAVGRRAVDGG